MKLEERKSDASLRGIGPDGPVSVSSVQWQGSEALTLVYRRPDGRVASQILHRDCEARLTILTEDRSRSFGGDEVLLRRLTEAHRIRLAHPLEPLRAVHTSLVKPLAHQIIAANESMLPRQHLRCLVADDPGAGKTIMVDPLIKELIVRRDLKRCLNACPGSLVEEWQNQLSHKFQPPFAILTQDKLAAGGRRASCTTRQAQVLLTTDAAGEGIKLQRAHLMVNHDVHRRLLEKLAETREALGLAVTGRMGRSSVPAGAMWASASVAFIDIRVQLTPVESIYQGPFLWLCVTESAGRCRCRPCEVARRSIRP
jgi:hypothetical protein